MPLFIDYLLSSNIIKVNSKAEEAQILSIPDIENSGYLLYCISNQLAPARYHICCCSLSRSRGAIPFGKLFFWGKKNKKNTNLLL